MRNCCVFLSLQTGIVLISAIFISLSVTIFIVSLPYFIKDALSIVLLTWIIGTLFVGISAFLAAYTERLDFLAFSTVGLSVLFIFWLIVSLIPILQVSDTSLRVFCLRRRCGESFWLMNLPWRLKTVSREHIECCLKLKNFTASRRKVGNRMLEWENTFLFNEPCNLQINAEDLLNLEVNSANENNLTTDDPQNKFISFAESQISLEVKRKQREENQSDSKFQEFKTQREREQIFKLKNSSFLENTYVSETDYEDQENEDNHPLCADLLNDVDVDDIPDESCKLGKNTSYSCLLSRIFRRKNRADLFPETRILQGTIVTSIVMLTINACFLFYCWLALVSYWRFLAKVTEAIPFD